MKRTILAWYIPPESEEQLKALARHRRMSIHDCLTDIVNEFLPANIERDWQEREELFHKKHRCRRDAAGKLVTIDYPKTEWNARYGIRVHRPFISGFDSSVVVEKPSPDVALAAATAPPVTEGGTTDEGEGGDEIPIALL